MAAMHCTVQGVPVLGRAELVSLPTLGHSVVSWASGGTIKKKSIKVIKSGLKTVEMHSNIIF